MATKISALASTANTLYSELKATATRHWGWTLSLDTPPVSNAFTLEFISADTIDGQQIKVQIASTTSSAVTLKVYNSLWTAVWNTNTTQYMTNGVYAVFYDGVIWILPYNASYSNFMAAWRIFDPTSTATTGKNNLWVVWYHSTGWIWSIIKWAAYSTAGVLTWWVQIAAPCYVTYASASPVVCSEHDSVNNWMKMTLFPIMVTQNWQYGIFGFLRKDLFFWTLNPSYGQTVWSNITLGGHVYRRVLSSSDFVTATSYWVRNMVVLFEES